VHVLKLTGVQFAKISTLETTAITLLWTACPTLTAC